MNEAHEAHETRIDTPGLNALEQAEVAIAAEEDALGIEWVGRGKGLNRTDRRAKVRVLRRMTRRPEACLTLDHPLTGQRTPYGVKVIAERRAKNKRARAARKRNRGNS